MEGVLQFRRTRQPSSSGRAEQLQLARNRSAAVCCAAPGWPSLSATPRASFFLPRGPVPFIAIRFLRKGLLFVGDATDVVLGLHRFYYLADECPAIFLRRLLKEIL